MANSHNSSHHIIPLGTYVRIFATLIVLTVITVAAAQVDFGHWNAVVAFFIATIKASLVLGFFMHLKYDDMMNRVIIFSGLFFVVLLYLFSILDISTRVVQQSTL
jgi:cytochrome c oxidase subunit IV